MLFLLSVNPTITCTFLLKYLFDSSLFLCSYHLLISLVTLQFTFQANLLTSKGLQRIIIEKEELRSERDQLAKRLPALEAKLTQMEELEAREQTEQEKRAQRQEVTQLYAELAELKGVGRVT